MSDNARGNAGDVFGGAARADDYVEEDTVAAPATPRRRAEYKEGLPELPPMPPTPVAVPQSDTSSSMPKLTVVSPKPASPVGPEVAMTAVRDRAESLSVLFGGSAAGLAPGTAAPTKATQGLRGALARVGLPIAPGPTELAQRQRQAAIVVNETIVRQATWTRPVTILVNNKKGGTGKTPVSLMLGGALGAIRGGSVAIFEVSDDPGALNFRAEGNPKIGLGELVRDVDRITNAGQLAGYTAPQKSFASVIGTVGTRPALTGDDVVKVSNKIGEFYAIRVMDSGNVPTSSAFQGAASVADILVIPVMNSGDSALEAIEVLDVLRSGDDHSKALADHAIVVRLKDGRPETEAVAKEVELVLREAGVSALHEIPYDPHIAERGQLTFGNLSPATREAFVAAAAGIVRSLQSMVSAEH